MIKVIMVPFAGVSASGLDEKITEDYQPKLDGFLSVKLLKIVMMKIMC